MAAQHEEPMTVDRKLESLEELTLDKIYEQLGKERWKPNPNSKHNYLKECYRLEEDAPQHDAQ